MQNGEGKGNEPLTIKISTKNAILRLDHLTVNEVSQRSAGHQIGLCQ